MGDPPSRFECQHKNCHRSYVRKEHLLRHEQGHTDIRPFRCHLCTASFKRRDLCNRHVALTHQGSKSKPDAARGKKRPRILQDAGNEQTLAFENRVHEDVPVTQNMPKSTPPDNFSTCNARPRATARVGQTLSQGNLELVELYFRRFHPHWPLLDERVFLSVPQPGRLVRAVLVAGLWMKKDPSARGQAQLQHDILLQDLSKILFDYQKRSLTCARPSLEQLPIFQAFVIPLILATYRGGEKFGLLTMNTRFLFGLFGRAGLFSQNRIDAQSPSSYVREQYQRLALIHFHIYLHCNALIITHFPHIKLFDYLTPQMLHVAVPNSSQISEGDESDKSPKTKERYMVSDMFNAEFATACGPEMMSSLVAWNFSIGMSLGCFLTQGSDEDNTSLMMRIMPNLFMHVKDLGAGF